MTSKMLVDEKGMHRCPKCNAWHCQWETDPKGIYACEECGEEVEKG